MRGGPAVMGETCVPSPRGKKVTLWGIATPLFDESGEITGAIESIRDITDRKKAEESLIQVNRKLNLLSSVTRHDILNQLAVLLGYLEVTAGSVTDPVLSENIARALRAAGAIRQQILFTSDYQDVGVNAPQWHDLAATWQHSAASAGQSPSTLVSDGAEDHFPRSTFSLFHDRSCVGLSLYADPLLGKVFSNLIENVVKHGVNATMVRLSSHQSPDGVIVVCEDNGRGVPSSLKETIFQRGYGSNTGYELFLAREILSVTGLSIREIGEEGKGGRFEILVPHGSFRFTGENRSEPAGL